MNSPPAEINETLLSIMSNDKFVLQPFIVYNENIGSFHTKRKQKAKNKIFKFSKRFELLKFI